MAAATFDSGYDVTLDAARIPIRCPIVMAEYDATSAHIAAMDGDTPTTPPAAPPTRLLSVMGMAMFADAMETEDLLVLIVWWRRIPSLGGWSGSSSSVHFGANSRNAR